LAAVLSLLVFYQIHCFGNLLGQSLMAIDVLTVDRKLAQVMRITVVNSNFEVNSVPNHIEVSQPKFSTLIDLLSYRAQMQADQTLFTFLRGGETETGHLTYADLHMQAQAIATTLQSIAKPGERALLLFQPGLEFIAAFFGCLYAGVIAVPAYPPRRNQSLTRLQSIAADAEATIVLTTHNLLETLQVAAQETLMLANLQWVATDALDLAVAAAWQAPVVDGDHLAFLQYTSGSTGDPKGVMISHGNLLHNSALIQACFQDTPQSQGVSWLPVYHDMGLIGGVLQPIYVGAQTVLMSPVDFLQKPIRWLEAVSRYGATTSGGPNFAYDLCIQKVTPEQIEKLDLSRWELAFTGAEPVRSDTLEKFAQTFAPCGFQKSAFYPCYGMAETTLIVSGGAKSAVPPVVNVDAMSLERNQVVLSKRPQDTDRQIVGCGQTQLEQQVLIVNPDTMLPCQDDQVGEIWVSGASVAQGYWNRAQQTAEAFQAMPANAAADSAKFLRTGDLGFVHQGELFVTGRLKDVIIIRGQNHYPQDIERTVEQSHAALRPGAGAAFAIDFKGAERLVIIQEVERSYLRKLDVQEVVSSIRQAVTMHHGLDIYATVLVKTGTIPKTSSGKIRRHACRAEFLTDSLDVVKDWSENPQTTKKFRSLQADVESVYQSLRGEKAS
jgi:acyl-CoA synthetase (AMP-forming)/AMP-acid ligase II